MFNTAFRCIVIAVIISFVVGLIGTVVFSWTLSTSSYLATLSSVFSIILYILPINQLSPILIITISSIAFRIVIRIIKTIWQLLPIRG